MSNHPSTCIARPEEIISVSGTSHQACEVCGWHTPGFENIALLSSHIDQVEKEDGTLDSTALYLTVIEELQHWCKPDYAQWLEERHLRYRIKRFQRKWLKPRRIQTMQLEAVSKMDDLQQVTTQIRGNSYGASHATGKLSTVTRIKGTTAKISPKRDDVSIACTPGDCTPGDRERLLAKLQNSDTKQMHVREAAKLLGVSERQVRKLKDPENEKRKLAASRRRGFVRADSLRRYLDEQALQPKN